MYNRDDGVIFFTVPNQDRRTVYKCDMNPHYFLCSVYKLNLVLYYSYYGGEGSTLLQHWFAFPKNLKESNKKKRFVGSKKAKYYKNIQR